MSTIRPLIKAGPIARAVRLLTSPSFNCGVSSLGLSESCAIDLDGTVNEQAIANANSGLPQRLEKNPRAMRIAFVEQMKMNLES